jgi:hypothetical protein
MLEVVVVVVALQIQPHSLALSALVDREIEVAVGI